MIEKNILCETYFGKPSQLVKAEEILTSLQEKIKSGVNINPEKECKELENIFAQTFGFEKCFISFLPIENSFNAFTVPFFNDVNYSEKTYELIRDKNGIRYKYPKGKSLYIYVHNYGMRHLSTEKIMATIIHEIGHNFFLLDEQIKDGKIRVAQNYILSVLNYMFEYIRVYGYIPLDVFRALVDVSLYLESPQKYMYNIATNFEAKLSDRAQKEGYNADKTYNNPVIKILRRSVKILFSIITLPLKMLGVGFSALLSPLLINRSAFKKKSLATQSYNNEKFADNFAMMYGYSVGIADLFANTQKMYNDGDVYDHIPVVRLFNYLDEMLTSTALFFADEHPHSYKRVLLAKQKVEYEMKNVRLSESQRKDLEDQLAKINNIINKAPAYKKMINKQFMKIIEEKDQIGSNKYSSEEIFDSDKTILKKYIKEDSNALIETFFNYKMDIDDLEYLQANGYSFTPNEEEQRVYTENHKILDNLSMNNIDKLKSLNEDQLASLLNSTNDYYKMTK